MQVKPVVLLKGIATWIPGVLKLACGRSFGTDSPRYCYSVWLRHVVRIAECGFRPPFPTVAELGPGDSFGIGLAAMLTGSSHYYAFDAVPHARSSANLETLDRLTDLFDRREPVPGKDEMPEISPDVASLDFPVQLLEAEQLRVSLAPERVAAIRRALADPRPAAADGRPHGPVSRPVSSPISSPISSGDGEPSIRYVAPWDGSANVQSGSIDLAFSQAVLEHVEDVPGTYRALYRWLKPDGVMSHAIDFRSHGLTRDWYGHWTVPARTWRLVRGRRPYLINRLPASAHIEAMKAAGFDVVLQVPQRSRPIDRAALVEPFLEFSDDDLCTSGLFVVARKPI